jgi:hypothetical protein
LPLDLKDLARTTVVATWDSAEAGEVVQYLIDLTRQQDLFDRYKQLSRAYFRLLQSIPAPEP